MYTIHGVRAWGLETLLGLSMLKPCCWIARRLPVIVSDCERCYDLFFRFTAQLALLDDGSVVAVVVLAAATRHCGVPWETRTKSRNRVRLRCAIHFTSRTRTIAPFNDANPSREIARDWFPSPARGSCVPRGFDVYSLRRRQLVSKCKRQSSSSQSPSHIQIPSNSTNQTSTCLQSTQVSTMASPKVTPISRAANSTATAHPTKSR